jgi:glycosyltransferase involved in cell wall biosynthesis
MIMKNEERHIARCLDSAVGIFDEIVVIDTGSTDQSKDIVRHYTDKILDFEWNDDFAAARNYSFENATSDYLMWMDADDVIPEQSREKLIELKKTLAPDIDIVRLPYHTAFDKNGNPTFSFYRERILRNCPQAHWEGVIHEAISAFGKSVYEDIPIEHHKIGERDPKRNLRIYEKYITEGNTLCPRDMFYYGRELYYHQRNYDAVTILGAFLNEGKGWRENNINACQIISYCCYRLNLPDQALLALLRSFMYDTPRAELCCDIGKHFLDRGQYRLAIFWYKQALALEPDYTSGAFILPDCYNYIPALQLCVCYSRLGDTVIAKQYNEMASSYKETEQTLYNKRYFGQFSA